MEKVLNSQLAQTEVATTFGSVTRVKSKLMELLLPRLINKLKDTKCTDQVCSQQAQAKLHVAVCVSTVGYCFAARLYKCENAFSSHHAITKTCLDLALSSTCTCICRKN